MGGSNGVSTFSNVVIFSLLKFNSTFVRKGRGVKVVKSDTDWSCYYLEAGGIGQSEHLSDRSVECWKYFQP